MEDHLAMCINSDILAAATAVWEPMLLNSVSTLESLGRAFSKTPQRHVLPGTLPMRRPRKVTKCLDFKVEGPGIITLHGFSIFFFTSNWRIIEEGSSG